MQGLLDFGGTHKGNRQAALLTQGLALQVGKPESWRFRGQVQLAELLVHAAGFRLLQGSCPGVAAPEFQLRLGDCQDSYAALSDRSGAPARPLKGPRRPRDDWVRQPR